MACRFCHSAKHDTSECQCCRFCGSTEHSASECQYCKFCGSREHSSSECQKCKFCGSTEHSASECQKCNSCGSTEHSTRECGGRRNTSSNRSSSSVPEEDDEEIEENEMASSDSYEGSSFSSDSDYSSSTPPAPEKPFSWETFFGSGWFITLFVVTIIGWPFFCVISAIVATLVFGISIGALFQIFGGNPKVFEYLLCAIVGLAGYGGGSLISAYLVYRIGKGFRISS